MLTRHWDYGIVAFVDILGFSAFIGEDSALETPKHLTRLMTSLDKVRATLAGETDVRAFSDSIVISSVLSLQAVADVVALVAVLQRVFSQDRVLVRGAIAFGKHYADKESMYSEALVRSYTLERKEARFPRVLMDRNLLDWYFNHRDLTSTLRNGVEPLLLTDRDGCSFIHYLEPAMLSDHEALIRAYDVHRISPSVLEKLQWLAAYHNYVATAAGSNGLVGGDIVGGFRRYVFAVQPSVEADAPRSRVLTP